MWKTRPALAILTALLFCQPIFSQKKAGFDCGFDALRTPVERALFEVFEKELAPHFLKKKAEKWASPGPFPVPVVVHIIHDGGAENIPDAQIFAAIDHLNDGFSAVGYFAQSGATVNTQIQFCLAKKDPDGNATSGITRDQSSLTNMVMETEDIKLKNINRWKPTDYVNIWVVNEISSLSIGSGVAGYAYFPTSHGGPVDGMVCEARFFGKSPADDAVLIHEMGHYFGLYHTFEGGCKNDNCAIDGDRVCDTPPDQATHTNCPYNSCSTDVAPGSPFTADVADATGDFLDYSPFSCYHFFTDGQAARMQAALQNARASLLASKGCQDPCAVPVSAGFSAAPNPVFAGQPVIFTNSSMGATSFEWSENGAVFSQNVDETRVFNTPGSYLIGLSAFGSEPNCDDKKFATIQVDCPILPGFSFSPASPKEGETVTFTNLTTGGATAFEWRINGQTVSTAGGFSYTFNNYGGFSVVLKAIGPFCSPEKQVWLNVAPKCGGSDTTVIFKDGNFTPQIWNVVPLPDGSNIFGGGNTPALIARVDAQNKPVWVKKLTGIQGCWEMVQLADGHFLLANQQVDLIKFDQNGNIIWAKNSGDLLLSGWKQPQWLIANPDSTFCVLSQAIGQPYNLSKFDLDGNLIWSTRFQLPLQLAGIVRLADGTGDFVALGCRAPNFFILRFGHDGALLKTKRVQLLGAGLAQSMGQLFAHADGGFSTFHQLANYATDPVEGFGKKIIRFDADGNVIWSKKYQTAGAATNAAGIVQLPGEGWFGLEARTSALAPGSGAFRIGEDGGPSWNRDFDKNHFNINGYFSGYKKAGALRFISRSAPVGLLWASILDDPAGQHCLLGQPFLETVQDQALLEFDTTIASQPFFPILKPITFAITNGNWSKTDLCQLPLPCPETCDNLLDDDSDGLVDCLDTDCACFDPDTACTISVVASLNPLIVNQLKVPDLALAVDSVRCKTDSFDVFLRVQNLGSAVFPAKMALAFYQSDPATTPSLQLFPPVFLDKKVERDSSLFVKLTVPATYNQPVFLAINDDGSTARPFVLTNDTLSTAQPECELANNFAQFVFQNQPPPLDLGPDILLCENSVVEILASPNFNNYRWQNGSTDPVFTAFGAGKYWVDAFDNCGFKVSDTINIVLNTAATLGLPDELTVCAGDTTAINAANFFDEYSWSPSDSLTCGDCPNPVLIVKNSITLRLTARIGGCFVADSVKITVQPAVQLVLQTDTLSCTKTSGQISATAGPAIGTTFLWSGPAGFSSQSSAPTVFQNGQFSVTATTSAGGCTAVATVVVAIDTLRPVAQIAVDLVEIPCDQTSVELSAAGSSFGPNFEVNWSATGGGSFWGSSQILNPTVESSGFYAILIENLTNGCSASDVVEVVALEKPFALELAIDPVKCAGETNGSISIVSTIGGQPPMSYSIDNQAFTSNTIFENLAAGTYFLTVKDANGCIFQEEAVVFEPPYFGVKLSGDPLATLGNEANLVAEIAPPSFVPAMIYWSNLEAIGPDNPLSQTGPIFETTLFSIQIWDKNGCSDSASWLVRIKDGRQVFVPNSIRPGSLENGVFMVFGGGSVRQIRSMQVFDNWGELVFEHRNFLPNDLSAGWDGRFRGKTMVPQVLAWVAEIEFLDGEIMLMKGGLTIVR